MKKTLSFILAICMCLSLGMALTACDFGSKDPEHTHTYETVWSYDDTYHWYACEKDTCTDVSQKDEHTIENGVCSVCGYEQSAPTPPPTPSANEVTEEQFYAAVTFDNVTNITVYTESNTNIVNGVQQPAQSSTTYLDGNKLKEVSNGQTEYVEGHDTYIYVYSYDEDREIWIRSTIEQSDGDAFGFQSYIDMIFTEIDFSDFSYENGYYVGSNTFELGVEPEVQEYTINYKLQFENGVLKSMRADYKVETFDCYDYMEFSDYGTTTVVLPTEYQEDGVEPTPPVTNSWASYFVFDNVTARKTSSTHYPDLNQTFSDVEDIKVQGEEWLWEKSDYYYNDTMYGKFAVYFDGSDAYVNGVVDNEMNSQSMLFFLNADFSAYESSFTETATGVFEAAEISAYGVYTYTDVCITISEGKIVSIEYTMNMSVSGSTYTQTVAYMFDLWDDTTIDGEKYTQPSAWLSYFDFENVTIAEIMQYVADGTNYSMETNWKVDNGSWVCNKVMEKVDGVATIVNQAYYDGTNYYLNGNLVSEADVYAYHYLSGGILGDLIGCEDLFNSSTQGANSSTQGANSSTQGAKTIYSADSITLYGMITYTDVELTVENGKLVKLTYKQADAALHIGEYYDGTYTLTFSDYGTTVVEGSTEPSHTCSFNKEVASLEYLRTSATCEELATYYYSCECEKKGTEWFEYGALADCTYGDWHSNNDGTHSKICAVNNDHILTDDCYGGSATCKDLAVCEGCGAEYGDLTPHDCSLEVEDNKFLISHCGEYAEYYKSCVCGLQGEEKFYRDAWEICDYGFWVSNGDGTHTRTCSRNATHTETENCSGGSASCIALAICDYCNAEYGSYTQHYYTYQIITDEYLESPATCNAKATYHWACEICGNKGSKTFEYGEALGCNYGDWASNGDSTHTRVCSRNNSHIETESCFGGNATCIARAHCTDCGSEYGEFLSHSFVKEVVDEKYLKTEATCNTKAVYYKSCECGLAGTDEFESTEFGDHSYSAGVCVWCKQTYSSKGLAYEFIDLDNAEDYYIVIGRGDCVDTDLVIPSMHNGYYVKGVASSAFSSDFTLHSLTLPDTIESVGDNAFGSCTMLKELYIGSGLSSIGYYAFGGMTNIEKITVSDENLIFADIGNCLVNLSTKTLVLGGKNSTIPNTVDVEILGESCFSPAPIVNLIIPNNIKRIESGAFNGCSKLETISIGSGVTYIDEWAFPWQVGESLISITVDEGNAYYHATNNCLIETSSKTLIRGCKNSIIPADGTVEIIGECAFHWVYFDTLIIPEGVLTIKESAFSNSDCSTLIIASSVKKIYNTNFHSWKTTILVFGGSLDYAHNAFDLPCLEKCYFYGSKTEFDELLGSYTYNFGEAQIYYYSDTKPTNDGNFWYYENDEIKIWIAE